MLTDGTASPAPQGPAVPAPYVVDLSSWVPGYDVDDDALVAEELAAARDVLAQIRAMVDVDDQSAGDYLAVLGAIKDLVE